jgi:hypothetical protein
MQDLEMARRSVLRTDKLTVRSLSTGRAEMVDAPIGWQADKIPC